MCIKVFVRSLCLRVFLEPLPTPSRMGRQRNVRCIYVQFTTSYFFEPPVSPPLEGSGEATRSKVTHIYFTKQIYFHFYLHYCNKRYYLCVISLQKRINTHLPYLFTFKKEPSMNLEPNFGYLRNVFDNATKNNYKRMVLLSRDHYDKLNGRAASNPVLADLAMELSPIYNLFYDTWRSSSLVGDERQSLTLQLVRAMDDLRPQVEDWDIRIMFVYRPSTVEYTYLMGNGRTSFYTSTYENRLATVKNLSDKLANYPNLADVKASIDGWLLTTSSVRSAQQAKESYLQQAQKEIERTRQELATKMHYIFARLLALHYTNPIEVENYYELKYLQRSTAKKADNSLPDKTVKNATISMKVAANNRKTVLKGSFTAATAFEVQNTGGVPLAIFLSNNEVTLRPSDATIINAGASATFYGDELSDNSTSLNFFIAVNEEGNDGKLKVTQLKG